MTTETTTYYNSKPSKISNLGEDLKDARRHFYDTYEGEYEKKARKEKKKAVEDCKAALKAEIGKADPCPSTLIERLDALWVATYGEDTGLLSDSSAREYVRKLYNSAIYLGRDERKEAEKLRKQYNFFSRLVRSLKSGYAYSIFTAIDTLRGRYMRKGLQRSKKLDHSGAKGAWKTQSPFTSDTEYLSTACRGLQFGNSLPDVERAHVLAEMTEFLKRWEKEGFTDKAQGVGYSFGARGKVGSVAYYAPAVKVISVNRGRIGSLIHELGHYLDHISGDVSNKISAVTIKTYVEKIRDKVGSNDLKYYASKKEIFARAVEEYIELEYRGRLGDFAICGSRDMHPYLCDELRELVKSVLY
jgi:hypothetical protein